MAFDITVFRASFTEFASTVTYPDALITVWGALAERQVRPVIWGDTATLGQQLYVAHEITLAAQSVKASSIGGVPGGQGGIANSKTVGQATVSYDTVSTAEKDAGYWNLTTYGKQFIRLARLFGAGGIQL